MLTVYDVGTEGDRDYIAMELVDGGSLEQWLAFGPPHGEVIEALLAAGRGLAAAHAAGFVHRDFKPNNVLRSKDGRVLVTDFGLARGLGDDETAAGSRDGEVGVTPTSRDNVLDSPLTQTGAMIGTPAYMAPEQFAGAEPDPRTDQFAFCVTAWQALTGARPFHGRTLDELRQAATAGVAAVVAELGKPMRAVLARGLDPDPAKRWTDMTTLLRELERAARPPTPKRPWIAAGTVAAIAIALIAYKVSRPAVEPPCEPVDTAWGDAIKVSLPDQPWLAATLDDHKRRWIASYDQTCKVARPAGRLDCLRAVRSRIAAVSAVLAKDPSTRGAIDPALYLAPPELCAAKGATPIAFPDDERVIRALARSVVRSGAEAQAAGWAALVPLVAVTEGTRRVRDGDVAGGRKQLEGAVAAAEATDLRVAAFARLGLLAASLKELVDPGAGGKPDALHDELAKLLTYARSAIKAAGDEPVLVGMLALLEAEALADLAERSRKTSLGDAIARAADARALFETAGDARRAAQAAALFVELQLRRGDVATLGDGELAARMAAAALERAKLPPSALLEGACTRIAFARGDLAGAHRWADRGTARPAITGTPISGVVVGPEGKPVMNAVVVAWVGELHGDPSRAFTDRTFDGEVVETDAEGKFTVHLRKGTVVMAEAPGGTLRSTPIALLASPGVTLRLSPTGDVSGRIESVVTAGVDAYARLPIGEAVWTVHAPISSAWFRVGNLPPGSYQLGATGTAGTATRRISSGTISITDGSAIHKKLIWPGGRAIDVVVRGAVGPGATAWLVDAETAARSTRRGDLDVVSASSFDSTWSPLIPIGSRTTDAGRQHYAAGAHHAIFVGDYRSVSACVSPSANPDAAITCEPLESGATSVAIDLPLR